MAALYKTATVVRITGFKPDLLRAWERRHGLLKPERSEGGHRLYTEDDLAVLLGIRTLTDQGRAIGEIAALGRATLLDRRAETHAPSGSRSDHAGDTELQRLRDRLLQAAVAVDQRAVDAALDEVFARCQPEDAVRNVLMPASRAVGEAWADGRCSAAGEHLVSSRIRAHLGRLLRWADLGSGAPAGDAIVACFPDELHENGALATAFRLARRGFAVTYLGAALPWADLAQAVSERKPDDVFLSVAQGFRFEAGRGSLLSAVERAPSTRFWIGGRGAPQGDDALEALGAVVGPSPALPSLAEAWARARSDRK